MGEFRRFTRTELPRVRALIRRLCANFDGGNCLLLDDRCPQILTASLICRYFRSAVLPNDRELNSGAISSLRRCRVCGASFFSVSNAAKYCRRCAARERRRKDAERKRQKRARSANRIPESPAAQGLPAGEAQSPSH